MHYTNSISMKLIIVNKQIKLDIRTQTEYKIKITATRTKYTKAHVQTLVSVLMGESRYHLNSLLDLVIFPFFYVIFIEVMDK